MQEDLLKWFDDNFLWLYYLFSILSFVISLFFLKKKLSPYHALSIVHIFTALMLLQQISLIFESVFRASQKHTDYRWLLAIMYFGVCYVLNIATICILIANLKRLKS